MTGRHPCWPDIHAPTTAAATSSRFVPGHVAGPEGVLIKEGEMSKTTDLFAVSAAALILACVAGWAISDTQARVAAPATVQIDPLTMSAKQMPPEHFADYS